MTTDHDDDYEALRRHYLGEQPADAEVERRLGTEPGFAELADAVVDELLQECALGQLPWERCAPLVSRLAATPEGQERLAFHRAFAKVVHEQADVPQPVQPVQPVLPFVRPPAGRPQHLRWAAALAAGILAAVIGIGLLPPHHPRDTTPQVWYLPAMVTRGPGAAVRQQFGRDTSRPLKIRVNLGDPQEYLRFRASISLGGEPVWSAVLAPDPGGSSLTLRLPAGKLAAGRYLLRLDFLGQDGQPEDTIKRKFDVVVQ